MSKIALSCDHLTTRDHALKVFESLCEVFEESEIYTLVHLPGAVLGPIEQRKIHSTYMSRFCRDKEDIYKRLFLVPGAARNLHIPCSTDLVINVSSGLSHGIARCEGLKQITYLYDFELGHRHPKTLRERAFRSFAKNWARAELRKVDHLWVASDSLKDELVDVHRDIKVIGPGFNLDDYPLFPEGQRKSFPYDFYMVNAKGVDLETARKLIQVMHKSQSKYKFVGDDAHLNVLKSSPEDPHFFGKRCSGELAPLLAAARGLIDFSESSFPELPLQSLATGRPVLVHSSRRNHDFLKGEGTHFFSSLEELEKGVDLLNQQTEVPDPKKLRASAIKYHNIKFKSEIKRQVERITS